MTKTKVPTDLAAQERNPWSKPATMPDSLPAEPAGWTRRMSMHIAKQGGGAASFTIYDPAGMLTPIAYQYDSAPEGLTGFFLPGIDAPLRGWAGLREAWPEWLRRARAAG